MFHFTSLFLTGDIDLRKLLRLSKVLTEEFDNPTVPTRHRMLRDPNLGFVGKVVKIRHLNYIYEDDLAAIHANLKARAEAGSAR
jgi:hypothetical protein